MRDHEVATRPPQKDLERRYLRKDGGIFWGLRAITRVQSAPDERVHKFVMIQDVTERKQAEGKIRFQAELLGIGRAGGHRDRHDRLDHLLEPLRREP